MQTERNDHFNPRRSRRDFRTGLETQYIRPNTSKRDDVSRSPTSTLWRRNEPTRSSTPHRNEYERHRARDEHEAKNNTGRKGDEREGPVGALRRALRRGSTENETTLSSDSYDSRSACSGSLCFRTLTVHEERSNHETKFIRLSHILTKTKFSNAESLPYARGRVATNDHRTRIRTRWIEEIAFHELDVLRSCEEQTIET